MMIRWISIGIVDNDEEKEDICDVIKPIMNEKTCTNFFLFFCFFGKEKHK